jgi:hypothetical protein
MSQHKPQERPASDSWMQTASGKAFHFFGNDPEEIRIEDIAISLGNICRFGGHCRFYSVAEHSTLVSRLLVPKRTDLTREEAHRAARGLLHDASETYLGDMLQPLKYDLAMENYRALEKFVQGRIGRRFGVDFTVDAMLVKDIDDRMLVTERKQLQGPPVKPWHPRYEQVQPLVIALECLPPPLARQAFMERWEEIQTALKNS